MTKTQNIHYKQTAVLTSKAKFLNETNSKTLKEYFRKDSVLGNSVNKPTGDRELDYPQLDSKENIL